jgi:hypothetical protein
MRRSVADSRHRSHERVAPRGLSTFLLKAREEGKTARRRRGVFSLKDTHSLSGLRGASRRAVSGVFRRPAALSSAVQALSRGASASSVSRLPAGVHNNPGRSRDAARGVRSRIKIQIFTCKLNILIEEDFDDMDTKLHIGSSRAD